MCVNGIFKISFVVLLNLVLRVFSCPSDWVTSNNNCYRFVINETRTWSDSATHCSQSSSHLVHVNSHQEHEFIASELRALSNNGDISHLSLWIGASDKDREHFWEWYDSNQPIIEYTNWNIGEPDTGDGYHEEDCACMVGKIDFRWQDRRCTERHSYICEMRDGGTGGSQVTASCESGWSLHGQSCYNFVTDQGRQEWDPANEYCKGHHAHLAIIETSEEDRYLAHEMGQRIELDHSNLLTGVWVGGTDADQENNWEWRDSVNHKDTPISGYTNWRHGQPDSGDGEKEEDCLCLIGSKGFQWEDYRCRDNMYFICEKQATHPGSPAIVG